MKLATNRQHKIIYQEARDSGLWPKIFKEDNYPANSNWSIKCLKTSRNSIYFFVWFILNLLLMLQVYRCYDLYSKGRTYLETKIVPQTEVTFPSMTICPETTGYKAKALQKHGFADYQQYTLEEVANLKWTSNDSSLTPHDLFRKVTYELKDIVNTVEIRYLHADKHGMEATILDLKSLKGSIKEQRHRDFGRCYTFTPDVRAQKLGIGSIRTTFHIDVELFFHGPDQFLDLSGRMGYKLYRGEKMESQMTIKDYIILERDEIDHDDDGFFSFYSEEANKTCTNDVFDDCVYDVMAREMRDNTGDKCTAPYVRDPIRICTKERDIYAASKIATNLLANMEHGCLNPCHWVTVDLGLKNYQNYTADDYAFLDLYFLPTATKNTEKLMYTILHLFAEIGGYLGLLLGYSLFSFFGWMNQVFVEKIQQLEGNNDSKKK